LTKSEFYIITTKIRKEITVKNSKMADDVCQIITRMLYLEYPIPDTIRKIIVKKITGKIK